MKLIDYIEFFYEQYHDKTAIVLADTGQHISYSELLQDIKRFAHYCIIKGIHEGSYVGIKLPNSYEWIVSFFGLLHIGAIPVLIDYRFTLRETKQCLGTTQASWIIKDQSDNHLASFCDGNLSFCNTITFFSECTTNSNSETSSVRISDLTYFEPIKYNNSTTQSEVILFTYRGIGVPLGVRYTEQALIQSAYTNQLFFKLDNNFKVLCILPFSHIFGLICSLISPLSVGGGIYILKILTAKNILKYYELYKINFLIAVPVLFNALIYMLNKIKYTLYLTHSVIGSDTFEATLAQNWYNLTNCILFQGFGLSETCPIIANNSINCNTASLGKTMLGVKSKILDNHNYEVSVGKPGRLWVYSTTLSSGYINQNILNCSPFKDGWFDTGDEVWQDSEGFYYFSKRLKAITKVGGNTVDLEEIKSIILSYPGINHVEITIEPDKLWNNKLHCYIYTKSDISIQEITQYAYEHIASYKVPNKFFVNNKTAT